MARLYWKCFHDQEPMVQLLSAEAAGRLFKAILYFSAHYEEDGSNIEEKPIQSEERILYMLWCNEVKRDSVKCGNTSDGRSKAGHKGGVASGKSRREKSKTSEANASKAKQMLQIEAKRSKEEEKEKDEEYEEEKDKDEEYEEDEDKGEDEEESICVLSPPGFVDFYAQYPRQIDEDGARAAWEKIKPDEGTVQIILSALEKWKQSDQWKDSQFIPYPANWLSKRLWESPPKEKPGRLSHLDQLYEQEMQKQKAVTESNGTNEPTQGPGGRKGTMFSFEPFRL